MRRAFYVFSPLGKTDFFSLFIPRFGGRQVSGCCQVFEVYSLCSGLKNLSSNKCCKASKEFDTYFSIEKSSKEVDRDLTLPLAFILRRQGGKWRGNSTSLFFFKWSFVREFACRFQNLQKYPPSSSQIILSEHSSQSWDQSDKEGSIWSVKAGSAYLSV